VVTAPNEAIFFALRRQPFWSANYEVKQFAAVAIVRANRQAQRASKIITVVRCIGARIQVRGFSDFEGFDFGSDDVPPSLHLDELPYARQAILYG
jgi:hypothetical protein